MWTRRPSRTKLHHLEDKTKGNELHLKGKLMLDLVLQELTRDNKDHLKDVDFMQRRRLRRRGRRVRRSLSRRTARVRWDLQDGRPGRRTASLHPDLEDR